MGLSSSGFIPLCTQMPSAYAILAKSDPATTPAPQAIQWRSLTVCLRAGYAGIGFRQDASVVSPLKNHATDSTLAQTVVSEVYDESERDVHELHIGEQLCFVPGHVDLIFVKRFTLDDQALVNETVEAEFLLESETFVGDRHFHFRRRLVSSHAHLLREGHFVDVLEKTDAEVLLHFDGGIDHFASESFSFLIERVHRRILAYYS